MTTAGKHSLVHVPKWQVVHDSVVSMSNTAEIGAASLDCMHVRVNKVMVLVTAQTRVLYLCCSVHDNAVTGMLQLTVHSTETQLHARMLTDHLASICQVICHSNTKGSWHVSCRQPAT